MTSKEQIAAPVDQSSTLAGPSRGELLLRFGVAIEQ
jgi:hypothetical protein